MTIRGGDEGIVQIVAREVQTRDMLAIADGQHAAVRVAGEAGFPRAGEANVFEIKGLSSRRAETADGATVIARLAKVQGARRTGELDIAAESRRERQRPTRMRPVSAELTANPPSPPLIVPRLFMTLPAP